MAWEFKYRVSVVLTHFSLDPQEISARIKDVTPSCVTKIGDKRQMRSGTVRVATNSVWWAQLHEPEFLHPKSDDFGIKLRECLTRLQPCGDVFREVRQTGYAYLYVASFADSNHSVGIIPADVLALCGSIDLDLDLEYYSSPESEAPQDDAS